MWLRLDRLCRDKDSLYTGRGGILLFNMAPPYPGTTRSPCIPGGGPLMSRHMVVLASRGSHSVRLYTGTKAALCSKPTQISQRVHAAPHLL